VATAEPASAFDDSLIGRLSAHASALARSLANQSLARQFMLAGSAVSVLAVLLVGVAVTSLIERAVTLNAGATTALYVDSIIAPLLPDMRTNRRLDEGVQRALDETLGQGALGERLGEMRLWGPDGTVLYSNDPKLVGRRFDRSVNLNRAFAGEMVVNFDRYDDLDASGGSASALLEIYNPILQPWSGEVVAVIEFYEHAEEFADTLRHARWRSWLAVAGVVMIFFLTLSAVVLRGSRTIDRQALALEDRVAELTNLLAQNRALHSRVQTAAKRVAALNEGHLRRIGADLHDGPAQLVALASLRLDGEGIVGVDADAKTRTVEVASIRACLDEALREIRAISHGLVLPQIENATLVELVAHAIDAFERRSGCVVQRHVAETDPALSPVERICIYRFLQEALNNAHRHCPGAQITAALTLDGDALAVRVADDGPGFDPHAVSPQSMGLAGLRDRLESLGGRFTLDTSPRGTTLTAMLPIESLVRA
jgi:signal transduction histidine kinase